MITASIEISAAWCTYGPVRDLGRAQPRRGYVPGRDSRILPELGHLLGSVVPSGCGKRAARRNRTSGRKRVARLFHAGSTRVSDPRLPAVMEEAKGRDMRRLRMDRASPPKRLRQEAAPGRVRRGGVAGGRGRPQCGARPGAGRGAMVDPPGTEPVAGRLLCGSGATGKRPATAICCAAGGSEPAVAPSRQARAPGCGVASTGRATGSG